MSAFLNYITKGIKYDIANLTNKMDEFFKTTQAKVKILGLRRVKNEKIKNLGTRVYHVMAVEKMKNPNHDPTVSELVVALETLELKVNELNAEIKKIKEIKMEERQENAKAKKLAMGEKGNIKGRQNMKDFFGFRKMVSSVIIKFIYILGFIILTIGGIVFIFLGQEKIFIGLGAIILGNLVWRIICEAWILVFSIHDILGSVEQTLREK